MLQRQYYFYEKNLEKLYIRNISTWLECKCGLGLQTIFFSHVNLNNNQHQSTGELLETLMDQFSENSRFWR